ncbi:MAG: hypothetical protein ACFCGT_08610 [Sandaracinaceae bacterium]
MKQLLWALTVGGLVACGGANGHPDPTAPAPPTAEGEAEGEAEAGHDAEAPLVLGQDPCATDADCVPAQCCHAAACVSAERAPACGDAICTMECRSRTMDCGGGCVCHEGRCAARLTVLEAPQVE